MAKQSKNAKAAQRLANNQGGKDFIKVVVPVKDPKTGAYSYKTKMVHKDKVDEVMKASK